VSHQDVDGESLLANEIVILYGWGPEEEGRLSSLIYILETAMTMKMRATVFLFTDGVILAKKGMATKISEEIGKRFTTILKNKAVKFYVCSEAAGKRGIIPENLEDNVTMAGYATFLNIAVSNKTVITI